MCFCSRNSSLISHVMHCNDCSEQARKKEPTANITHNEAQCRRQWGGEAGSTIVAEARAVTMDSTQAAVCLQALARRFLARTSVIELIRRRWEKAYDPRRRRYYYFDTKEGISRWRKPRLLWSHDIIEISPTYHPDYAAVLIQRQWRAWTARVRVATLYGQTVRLLVDEQSGNEYWYNPRTGAATWELPQFMTTQVLV